MRQAGFACALLLAATAGNAQGIKATVLAGAGGYVRSDSITPVMVILENDGRDRTGELVASLEALGTDGAEAITRLELPTNSRKAVFLYVPAVPEPVTRVRVQYRTDRGQILLDYSESLNASASAIPVIGSFERIPPSAPPAEDKEDNTRFVDFTITPEQLPDRFEGLLMYDAFFLSPAPATPLSRSKVDAIYEWVLRGGILVVDASQRTDSLLSGTLPALLPFRPEGLDQIRFDIFGEEVPFARGDVRTGRGTGRVQRCPPGYPTQRRAGFGRLLRRAAQ